MRTITYSICEYRDDEVIGDGFTVVFTETLHATTGDEQTVIELPMWFDTRGEAQEWIDSELASMAELEA